MVAPKRQRPLCVAGDLRLYALAQILASSSLLLVLALVPKILQRSMTKVFLPA